MMRDTQSPPFSAPETRARSAPALPWRLAAEEAAKKIVWSALLEAALAQLGANAPPVPGNPSMVASEPPAQPHTAPLHALQARALRLPDLGDKGAGPGWRIALQESKSEEDARLAAMAEQKMEGPELENGEREDAMCPWDERVLKARLERLGELDVLAQTQWIGEREGNEPHLVALCERVGRSALHLAHAARRWSLFEPVEPKAAALSFWALSAQSLHEAKATDAVWRGWALALRRARARAAEDLTLAAPTVPDKIAARDWAKATLFCSTQTAAPNPFCQNSSGVSGVGQSAHGGPYGSPDFLIESLSPEQWEVDCFELFALPRHMQWPNPQMEASERDDAWALMESRGGLWRRIWETHCADGWDGFLGKPRRAAHLPASILGKLFACGAWQWLKAVPEEKAIPLSEWEPSTPQDGELLSGDALWLTVQSPAEAGLNETLDQLERIYGKKKAWSEAYDLDGKTLDNWQDEALGFWMIYCHDPLHGRSPYQIENGWGEEPVEGLLLAWSRMAHNALAAGVSDDAWCQMGFYSAGILGEAFVSVARDLAPSRWLEWIREEETGCVKGLAQGWMALGGKTRGGIPVVASEWLFFWTSAI